MILLSRLPSSLAVVLAAGLLAGCNKDNNSSTDGARAQGQPNPAVGDPQQPNPADGNAQRPKQPVSGIRRAIDRQKVQNDLKQMALFYANYIAEHGKAPAKLEQFKDSIKREGRHLIKALEDGDYVLVLVRSPGAETVLAYEKNPDFQGKHIVAMGDASVQTLTTADLQKKLKNQ